MATNLPSCFLIQFLAQLLKFLVNFTLLKYVKSQRSYGFLITKELIFGFQILDLKYHFSASFKIDPHLIIPNQTKAMKSRPYIHVFLENVYFTKKLLNRFFRSLSSLGLSKAQLKYQRVKRLKLS